MDKGTIVRQYYHSNNLNNGRDIDIYLPPSYNYDLNKRYPVLYMHDGNNLFYPSLSFGGVAWGVDNAIERLVSEDKIEEVIVVGIHNTYSRSYEYTWTPMTCECHGTQGGGGEKYARFIVEELKSFIDNNFRTLSDRDNTAVMGSSMGGLISLYLGIHYPDVFSKLGLVSTSFWWGMGAPFSDIENISSDLEIWIDMGNNEGFYKGNNWSLIGARKMREKLLSKGYKEGINLGYHEDDNGYHNEDSWARRVHMPLEFHFSKR